jgi:hypothetical protein
LLAFSIDRFAVLYRTAEDQESQQLSFLCLTKAVSANPDSCSERDKADDYWLQLGGQGCVVGELF